MSKSIDSRKNYEKTKKEIGYVARKDATQKDYDRIGFMSGLEVHQQLNTKEKLFCRCPAGVFHENDDYDAEVIRHMRPTLSELGEYDGTALMEFKTRKEIIYKINNETACTYEVDDTPPFKIDKEALEIAIEISLLSKLNIVGEVHITRKQYLDGSIPTGFQRTAIIGVEGEIQLKNKKIRLIQLSLEEDSCREISDIGHTRVYKTDRLGMPLIETVTYPEFVNPDEVMEGCNYIRFLNRSTDKVRTGIGAGRQDVNVSCKGGTRVEIKGVAHTKWIPELTHNECFRQWALLNVRKKLKESVSNSKKWKISSKEITCAEIGLKNKIVIEAENNGEKVVAVNLPGFNGILSHFTQPGKIFLDEISDRLKVIACIEKPNIASFEALENKLSKSESEKLAEVLKAKEKDAQFIFWGPEDDIKTALETIEERCIMAFEGVPNETRKSFADGSTIFERVLPGADRMYPDTDSAPIPLQNSYIESLKKDIPMDVIDRMEQMKKWGIPEDTFTYLLKNNLVPLIERINKELKVDAKFLGTILGHRLKYIEGHYNKSVDFDYKIIYALFKYLKSQKLDFGIAREMLPILYQHPKMEFESVLTSLKFKKRNKEELTAPIGFLKEKFKETGKKKTKENEINWVMGELRKQAVGNLDLKDLRKQIENN
ncbi:MAG: Glu-tRNA(Gln) amidotransferase GatDE subunit E [Marinilabiliales bacterium]|nr:MAG: Glu-tRNA(Gln) amidotransferase GatDE subunit E [Marinilabiliales bacterium]